MAKKKASRKKTVTNAEGGAKKKRGRQPNKWIEGFEAKQLVDYRKKHDISEAKLAAYLDTTLTSLRNWISGKNTPGQPKQKEMQELLAKDYVAPPAGEKKPRGRRKKGAETAVETAAPAMTTSVAVARDAVASNGGAQPKDASAIAAVVLEYVRRLPQGQALSIEELEGHIARIKRALG